MLADLGYDVWLGNYRGNTYSRRHEHLDPENLDFWQWRYFIIRIIRYNLNLNSTR